MSKKINVNPDHYKVAGRERQGEDIVQSIQRQAYAQQQAHAERWQANRPEGAPAQEEIRQIPVESEPAKKPSRPAAAKAKAKAKAKTKARAKSVRSKAPKTKAARAPKASARKRKASARKTRPTGKRGK